MRRLKISLTVGGLGLLAVATWLAGWRVMLAGLLVVAAIVVLDEATADL